MGAFDPSTFLDTTTSDANSTSLTPVPEGEYTAVAGEPKAREWSTRDGSKSGVALDIPWTIDDPFVKASTGRDTNIVTQGLMLDTNASGGLDTGKGMNVGLGKLREAVGLNTPGKPFSFRMLQGCVAKVKVTHRLYNDQVFAEIKAVTKAG